MSMLVSVLKRNETVNYNSLLKPASCLVLVFCLALVLTPASLISCCNSNDSDVEIDLNFMTKIKHCIFSFVC